ncbi:ureidoglycolate lyase [Rhizobiaceae bacterium BDR2-2]|uniref:Ureidoglycolate lyase n=1 Tax=Ectorhizobium quercum TaxID=2965071 RepID=A0AAE3SV73_9HYPH|nr:ureidoglycolate lyase [Ectorhizobium quercum]MCX8996654.1 ureidoglycolate lyase [Ectorhizobium quercum]
MADDFLPIEPLSREAFAPFGDVIDPDPASMRLINGGTTRRFDALARVEAYGEDAEVVISIFRGEPRRFPYLVTMMERHPLGSQSFSPLSGRPFLVVVSEDRDGIPAVPRVFLASGGQGVNYRSNVWHHPLMTLGAVSDFLVVDRLGPGNNLEEYFFDTPYLIGEPTP